MPRYITDSFSVTSVGASSSKTQALSISGVSSTVNIVKVSCVPSLAGGTAMLQIYKDANYNSASLVYTLGPSSGTLVDPVNVDSGTIVAANEGFVVPFEDTTATNKFYVRVTNNDSQTKNFTVNITYEVVWSPPVSGDLSIQGNLNWYSGTAYIGTLDHANTANRVYTLPNATCTLLSSKSAVLNDVAAGNSLGASGYAETGLNLEGTLPGNASRNTNGIRMAYTLQPAASRAAYLFNQNSCVVQLPVSGTCTAVASIYLSPPTVTTSGATLTNYYGIFIAALPSHTYAVTGNYALWIQDGNVRLGDRMVQIANRNNTTGAGPFLEIGYNNNGTTPAASHIKLYTRSGSARYLWFDNTGDLRAHTSAPTNATDTSGTVVGTQS